MSAYEDKLEELRKKYGVSEQQEDETPGDSGGTVQGESYDSILDNLRKKYSQSFAEEIKIEDNSMPIHEVDADYINHFLDDAHTFLNTAANDWDKISWSTAMDEGASKQRDASLKDLNYRASLIGFYLDKNADALGAETTSNLQGYLDAYRADVSTLTQVYREAKNFYSQWDSEDKYLAALEQQKSYDDKINLDLGAAQKEIEELERKRDEMRVANTKQPAYSHLTGSSTMPSSPYAAGLQADAEFDKELYDLAALISQKRAYLNQAKYLQEWKTLSAVSLNEDFAKFSVRDAKNSDMVYSYINGADNGDREKMSKRQPASNYNTGNAQNASSPYAAGHQNGGNQPLAENLKIYDYMRSDEIAIYNYHYAKDGKEAADRYLWSIKEQLNSRKATDMFEDIEGNTGLELLFGIEAGFNQFTSGLSNLFNTEDDYIPQTAYQIASGMVREDLIDAGPKLPDWMGGASLGQVGYDAITTTTNMLPSILTSTAIGAINPAAGAATGTLLMGSSAAGNAYQEMLNLGYDKGQARLYSTMVGASEAGLQYLLGGVGKLGGKLSNNTLTKMLNGVDNAFARTAIKLGGNMLSEGIEEGLQEILTPYFKNLVMYTDEDVNWSEVAYSSLLGMLTAGFMEGPSTISGEVNTYKTGKQLESKGFSADRLAKIGKTFSSDTVAYQLAGRVNENTGAYTIGRLFNEIGATMTEQNVNDITAALVNKGMDEATARKNAEAMAVVVEGGNLTDLQVAIIESNEVLAEAVRTTIIDSNATWFQRTKGYNEVLMALAQEKADPKVSQTSPAEARKENAPTLGKVDAKNENSPESDPEVDTSPSKVKSISAIQKGNATIKLDDGSEVSVRDADLSPEDGVIIETIASIAGISVEDANYIFNTLRAAPGASAQMDALGAKEAYKYGLYGFSQEHITRHGVFANSLTEAQRQAIYETGQKARQKQIEKATPKKGTVTNKETGIYFDNGNGDVVAFKDAKKTLTDKQSAGVKFAMVLKKLGIGGDIYFFESYINSKGKRVYKDKNGMEVKAPNGWYSKDGSIHIDLKAGSKGEGFVLFTLSHEVTHFIEQWSPQKYKILADFLVENYEKGQSMDKLVRAKQAKLSASRGKKVSYKEAYSEVVADSMEAMLSDANVLEKLVALKAKDNGLFMKMKQFFDNLLKKIRSIYKGQVPDSVEGRAVLEMTDSIERLQQLFAEALVDASENFRTAEKNTTVDGDVMYMSRDIASVTEDTVREDLTDIFNGINVASKSYIPLTKTTPFAVRYITRDMADRPIIVDKKKAYFDMRKDGIFKEDSNHHYHGMGVDGFLEAMDILNDPGCAIEEEMKNGDIHYAFISTNEDGYEVCVAFQMSVFKPEYTMNGYPGGLYNLDITEFVATDEWMEAHGVEPGITYKDYLLSFTKNKLVYDRKFHLEQLEKAKAEELEKARNTDVGSAGLAASHINNRAFGDKVTHPGTVVKTESLTPGEEGTIVNQNGDPVAHSTEDGTVQLSMRTYDEDGREAFRKYLQKCVTSKKLTKAEMQDMLDGIEEIYGICKDFKDKYAPFSSWSDAAVVRDTHGKPVFSVVTPNGDYKMNLDFSLVCKKRRTLDAVFNEMSRRGIIDDFELGQKSVVKINEIIRRNGLETACALCFVDAKRFRQASMADQFTRLYNELVESLVPEDQKGNIDHFNFSGYATIKKVEGGIDTWDNSKLDFSHINHVLKTYGDGTVEYKAAKYIKTHAEGRKLLLRGDFMSSQGFDAVKTQNQDILKLYNSKKGTGGPKAAFGDVQYMNEVIQKARRWTPKKAYEVGGIRIQSFSDYVPRMVFDYVQMVYDLAATKLPAHAYTKEALFVKQFGLTGIKINMSLIPAIAEGGIAPGLDANGNYVWAGESFDFETAKEIQNAEGYTENCGTICVGVSYKHIVKLLSDPNIRMVIPYHKSGLNPIVAHMNKIAEFTDYTTLKTNPGGCQNTIDKNGSKVAVDFNFNEVLRKTGDPKATVRQYLDWCSKHEYTPRFAEFAWHENYYKLIEDFTLYDKDGNYVPQREVRAVFPKADSAFGSMKDLIKAGLEEDAIVEGKRDARLSSIVDEIQRTIPKTEAEIAEEQVAQADKDLEADIQMSDRDTTYLDAVYRGDMETAQRMVDEAAKMAGYDSTKLYHGTSAFGFTQIDTKKSNDRISFFATDSMQTAGTYSGTSTVRSLGDESKSSLGMYQLYANTDGMVEFDAKGAESNHIALGLAEKDYNDVMYGKVWYSFATAKQLAKYAKRKGYTGVIIKNVVDSATPQSRKTVSPANVYIFFDSNQIKSADPVTYDDSGNVIPLSQRFNTEKDDIRYSDRDSTGKQLSREQQEFFKDSKARDDKGRLKVLYHGTEKGGFTEFIDTDDIGYFFTDKEDVAWTYSGSYKEFAPKKISSWDEAIGLAKENGMELKPEWYIYTISQFGAEHAESDNYDSLEALHDDWEIEDGDKIRKVYVLYYGDSQTEYKEDELQSVVNDILANQEETDVNYMVYLNIKDPLVINGNGSNWDNVINHTGTMVTYDELTDEQIEAIADEMGMDVEDITDITDNSGNSLAVFDVDNNWINYPQSTREWVIEAKDMGCDGVIFKDIDDAGKFGRGYGAESTVYVVMDSNQIKSVENKKPTSNPDIRYSERVSNKELAGMDETALYIKNTDKANYIGMIFNGTKTEETRTRRTLDAFIGKDFYVTDGKRVYGSIVLGEPHKYTEAEFHKKDNRLKHRVPIGDEYDIKPGGIKWAYPIESYKKFDKPKKLSDSTEYKNSFQARQVLYSDRDTESVSNRSLLANAFEGIAKPEEQKKVQEYKEKIDLINAEEKKLRELNRQIKELSFANGPKDTKKLKELRFDANQAANRINTYDKQLLRLEASQPLQDVLAREKKLAYQRAEKKGKEALEAYRERATKTQRELMNRWQESRKKVVEGREKTAMRHKIQNVVKELNDLLLNGDKKRHVPENLKKAVADALALVNMDTVGAEERAAKYAALIAKETDPDKIDAYTVSMENILRQGEKMGQRLKELRDAYEEISESDDPDIANAYDPVIAGCLKELSQSIGNTSLRNMTIEQLSDVYDMYKMVLTRVRDANKSLIESIKESIANRASRVVGEIRRVGGEHKYRAAIIDPVRKFLWNNLKPVYAFEHLGSATLTEAFNGVRKGEDTWATDVTEARGYYLDKSKKYGYDSWDFKKKYRFTSASELEFELTLEQILSLYAYSKREQAHDHLRLGGFVFDSNIETYKEDGGKLKYKVNTADAHQLTPEILANIIGTLTSEQMAFVDEMQEYLSTVMGAKGNDVTMKMYGVKLFKEKFYFPLKSAKQFMFEQNEVSGEVKIKNSGFTNKVVAKANNPVILSNFMDVWANHVNDMSMYHSFVLPLEDFNRIFNYNSPKKENQPSVSVKGTIQSAYSPAAVNYVKQLVTDLNGGAVSDPRETIGKSLMSKFKKAKVFSSLSVVIQQPSAIGRAFALVNPRYFHATMDGMKHDELWAELKKYAPVAIIKEMGYFDTNMGRSAVDFIKAKEYTTFKEKVKALLTDGEYRDELLSKGPALADELTWCAIWNAVKRETKEKHDGLDIKSEPFLMLAGARFTEVITKTQVYDSILARSANMRSKTGMMSMVTAFMAEPTTSINMLEDALRKSKRGYKGLAARAFASVAASVILNNALVALVYGMRDDDEDETFAEKYMQAFVSGMLDDVNPVTYYPYLKDLWSVLQGYDVERSDMSLVSDFTDAMKKMVKAYTTEDGDVVGAWWDMAGAVANIGGIPMQNIRRDVNGAINFFNTLSEDVNGRATTLGSMGDALEVALRDTLPVVGWLPGESKADKLYDAIMSGDKSYVNRLKGSYKDENAYHNAVRTALRENDPRIKEAAIAGFNGDPSERVRIARLIIKDGFAQDDVVAAINAEINKMKPDDESTGTKTKGIYTAGDFALEIANGDHASANAVKSDCIRTLQKNGKTTEDAEKSFRNSAKDELKDLYLDGKISADKVINALVTYCGFEREDAVGDIQYWDFKRDYPELFADDAWIDEYYEEVESSGIGLRAFVEYRNKVKGIEGADKKERRMEVINSMPLTIEQKDALYLAEGWAESKLWQAPWH